MMLLGTRHVRRRAQSSYSVLAILLCCAVSLDGHNHVWVVESIQTSDGPHHHNRSKAARRHGRSWLPTIAPNQTSNAPWFTFLRKANLFAVTTMQQQQQDEETSTTSATPSVHLQLQPEEDDDDKKETPAKQKSTTVQVHTHVDQETKQEWMALNTSKRKFRAFLQHMQVGVDDTFYETMKTETVVLRDGSSLKKESSNSSPASSIERRQEWRRLWKAGRLLTDRTELLAIYPSDTTTGETVSTTTSKRGGFSDLLHLYTDRLVAILQDEQSDKASLVEWLAKDYGRKETALLEASVLQKRSVEEQLETWKHFLQWFRQRFPYYYDRCASCGASIKEDKSRIQPAPVETDATADDDEEEEDCKEHQTFMGYTYPDATELAGKASRTELYQCHACHSFTRFPRFNAALHVMQDGRGRCGEYSMLLFRFLRALGHNVRWVVDWADHVWAEVAIVETEPTSAGSCASTTRWVHLDPCEAAVDQNLLYQDWGKKQTYILGFYAPLVLPKQTAGIDHDFLLIQDITANYTSDSQTEIDKRREESPDLIKAAIAKATASLEERLASANLVATTATPDSQEAPQR